MLKKIKNKSQVGVFLGSLESTVRGGSKGISRRAEEWKALKLRVKA
jgi:hypothetical protein